jgi:signal transduction histidine kinase
VADVVDHRVRNILTALRGHLELAHESATSEPTGQADLVEDLSNALDALGRLEARLGVEVDTGRRGTSPANGAGAP